MGRVLKVLKHSPPSSSHGLRCAASPPKPPPHPRTCHALPGVLARYHPDVPLALPLAAHAQQVQVVAIQRLALRKEGRWSCHFKSGRASDARAISYLATRRGSCTSYRIGTESGGPAAHQPSSQPSSQPHATHQHFQRHKQQGRDQFLPVLILRPPATSLKFRFATLIHAHQHLQGHRISAASAPKQGGQPSSQPHAAHQHLQRHVLAALHLRHQLLVPLVAAGWVQGVWRAQA